MQKHTEAFIVQSRGVDDSNTVVKVMVFHEIHSNGQSNYYAAVLAERPYAFAPVLALLRQVGVYVSFSTTHTYFWTCVIYGAVPSEHKLPEEIDTAPYHSQGLQAREELLDVPRGARKCDKDRVRAFLGPDSIPSSSSLSVAAAPRTSQTFGKVELENAIVASRWVDKNAVMTGARAARETQPELYNFCVGLGSARSEEFVEWVWELHGENSDGETDRITKLVQVRASEMCICGGRWIPAAEYLLELQGVSSSAFREAVCRALRVGRNKGVNVVIYGEPDAGKSFVFKVLGKIYKTFIRRGQNDRYPLQGLHAAEARVLQDVRYESFGLPWDDWLTWGENEELQIKLPRNNFRSSVRYTGSAPLFATMCDLFSYPPAEAMKTGRGVDRENVQWRSRWNIVHFPPRVQSLKPGETSPSRPV